MDNCRHEEDEGTEIERGKDGLLVSPKPAEILPQAVQKKVWVQEPQAAGNPQESKTFTDDGCEQGQSDHDGNETEGARQHTDAISANPQPRSKVTCDKKAHDRVNSFELPEVKKRRCHDEDDDSRIEYQQSVTEPLRRQGVSAAEFFNRPLEYRNASPELDP